MKFNKQAYMAKDLRVHNIRMESENGEEGGDSGELVPGRSIRFTGINLTEKQFNEIYGHPAASKFFYDFSNGDKGRPAHENAGTIWLDQVYKGCSGSIIFGTSNREVEFQDARVKNLSVKIKGEARFGSLALTLVAAMPVKIDVLYLEQFFGKIVSLKLVLGDKEENAGDSQGRLELEDGKDGDSNEADGDAPSRHPTDGDESRPH